MAKYRSRMSRKKSKRLFKKTANRTHKRNVAGPCMRGGTRL